jgi:cyanobactin cluster PatC/TenC/TruC protein
MPPKKANPPQPEQPAAGEPPASPPPTKKEEEIKVRLEATGLEDYGYWWQEMAKAQAAQGERKPFRRGRIWS